MDSFRMVESGSKSRGWSSCMLHLHVFGLSYSSPCRSDRILVRNKSGGASQELAKFPTFPVIICISIQIIYSRYLYLTFGRFGV